MRGWIPGLLLLLLSCEKPLVHEDYGTVNGESINGFDLLKEHLASKYDVQTSSFFDRQKRYDLVIYLQKEHLPELAMMELHQAIIEMLQDEEETSGNSDAGSVALLILQRGTTASQAFWSRQGAALSTEKKEVHDFIAEQIRRDTVRDELTASSFFFERRRLKDRSIQKRIFCNHVNRKACTDLPATIPAGMAIIPQKPLHDSVVYLRSPVIFSTGSYFVEVRIPGKADVFLVSDSAPFLNYHMMRRANVDLLDFIVRHSMKDRSFRHEGKPKILILEHLLLREKRMEMERERLLYSFLLQPPWNLPASLLLGLFLLFVWSRLKRERPVTEVEPESREGDLIKHFDGVGQRLAAISAQNKRKTKKRWRLII